MNQYEVYIQDVFYKTITAKTTGDALKIVSKEIEDQIPNMDYTKPSKIKIIPIKNP